MARAGTATATSKGSRSTCGPSARSTTSTTSSSSSSGSSSSSLQTPTDIAEKQPLAEQDHEELVPEDEPILPPPDDKEAELNATDTNVETKTTTTTEDSGIVDKVEHDAVVEAQVKINKTTAEEPEIPSFREYTQKALEEEERKREEREKEKKKNLNNHIGEAFGSKENTTGVNANTALVDSVNWHQKITKKNFASLDCGAKVAAANQEAQNALNIISPSK